MKIYFCGAILGGREQLDVYRYIVSGLQARGHNVPTHHVASPNVLDEESTLTATMVFERDGEWLRTSDIMVAEVSTPSLGVGYEIACGLQRGIPVLCLYRQGIAVSKMITGNSSPNLQVKEYRDMSDLNRLIDQFLSASR
jgi:2'-deoxynucleoside 5'-phosphate N-hydrolase